MITDFNLTYDEILWKMSWQNLVMLQSSIPRLKHKKGNKTKKVKGEKIELPDKLKQYLATKKNKIV